MALVNINLLADQQSRLSRLNQANFVVAVVAGAVIGLQLLIVVFLYSTIGIRSAEKKNLINNRQEYEQKIADINKKSDNNFYKGLTLKQQANSYQSQLTSAQALIDNHKYFSLYMSEIAANTPPTVVYRSISSDTPSRLSLIGQATSYGDVAKLAESFKQLTFAKGTSIQDAKLSGSVINFTIIIDLKSAAELNKLPGPIPRSGESTDRPKSSPKPTPGPSPSPGGGG